MSQLMVSSGCPLSHLLVQGPLSSSHGFIKHPPHPPHTHGDFLSRCCNKALNESSLRKKGFVLVHSGGYSLSWSRPVRPLVLRPQLGSREMNAGAQLSVRLYSV